MSAMPPSNAAAEHIEIVREIHIQPDAGIWDAHALAQTKERGYVIVGVDHSIGVATRIDASGRVQWHHMADLRGQGAPKSDYQGVAVLPDDSTLLCGWRETEPRRIDGLLTRIDKDGKLISQRAVHPNQGDETLRVNHLDKCVPWGDGVAVIGHTARFSGHDPAHPQRESFAWILALDAKAEVKWEKLIPGLDASAVEVLVMPNQDLVIQLGAGPITRIGPDGAIKAQELVRGWLVRPTQGSAVVAALLRPDDHTTSLRTLGEQLDVVKTVTGTAAPISPKAATYQLPDGGVVVFGFQRGPVLKAAISWIGADMNKHEKLIFGSLGDSIWVSDAVPTGNPGEFAALRPVIVGGHSGSSDQFGMSLSFIQIK